MHQQFFRKIIQASLQGVLRRLKCSFSMSKKSQMLFSSVMLNFVLNFPSAVSWHKLYDMYVIRCRSCRLLNTASFLHEMSHSSSFVGSSFKTFSSYFQLSNTGQRAVFLYCCHQARKICYDLLQLRAETVSSNK